MRTSSMSLVLVFIDTVFDNSSASLYVSTVFTSGCVCGFMFGLEFDDL
jgi:hypothetical protein